MTATQVWDDVAARGRLVQLWTPDDALRAERDRVELSDGTIRARDVEPPDRPLLDDARLPREPWREATAHEHATLWPAQAPPIDRAVGLVRLFARPELNAFREQIDAMGKRHVPHADVAADRVLAWLLRRCSSLTATGPFDIHGVKENPAGRRGITFDSQRDVYIGFHIDNWEGGSAATAATARNRIAINVGRAPRFLIFINVPPLEMARFVDEGSADSPIRAEAAHDVLTSVMHRFLRAHPDYPAVRLRVDPGEAYIAPTESLAHDGSSFGSVVADRVLTIRGHFTFAATTAVPAG